MRYIISFKWFKKRCNLNYKGLCMEQKRYEKAKSNGACKKEKLCPVLKPLKKTDANWYLRKEDK